MVLLMFFEALYFGHCLSFYTMQLEAPKRNELFFLPLSVQGLAHLKLWKQLSCPDCGGKAAETQQERQHMHTLK